MYMYIYTLDDIPTYEYHEYLHCMQLYPNIYEGNIILEIAKIVRTSACRNYFDPHRIIGPTLSLTINFFLKQMH